MKKNKFILTVLVFALALCMLVACGEKPGDPTGGDQGGGGEQPVSYYDYDLNTLFSKYENDTTWNFKIDYDEYFEDLTTPNATYQYEIDGLTEIFKYSKYTGDTQQDYIEYDSEYNMYYYEDNGDGTYKKYSENDDGFDNASYYYNSISIGGVIGKEFVVATSGTPTSEEIQNKYNKYTAVDASSVANDIIVASEDEVFDNVTLIVENDNVSRLIIESHITNSFGTMQCKYVLSFYGFGTVSIDLDELVIGGGSAETTTYKVEFTDDLFANNSGISFSANKAANDFANGRGVQFMQKNGEVEITTDTSLSNVTKVTLCLITNCDTAINSERDFRKTQQKTQNKTENSLQMIA